MPSEHEKRMLPAPAIWAGVECTVNRVGERWHSQLHLSGHWERASDLDRIAALKPQRLRYPVLWELVAPFGDLSRADWSWSDERLGRLRELGIQPIVGLVHHGNGPWTTNLLDPDFAARLGDYAAAVAERYPWVEDWTPVNEPLTTARFGALYGVWFPHRRDVESFAQALLNQCRGIAAAMRAVRRVQPRARLVQTEDLGTVTSTPRLRYQADFENERRWLSYDLLFGLVDEGHPMRGYLRRGVSSAALDGLVAEPCPPDVVGINYYATSDRFLDERLELYPERTHGGNGRERYADIESVRVERSGLGGHEQALRLAWERYRRPVAITEAHIDSTREDQLRWFQEAWSGALAAQQAGAEVEAVTAWALLGSFDWNSLLTCQTGYYEAGAFDLRNPRKEPRPTAVSRMVATLARSEPFEHPVLEESGWWRRSSRVLVRDPDFRVPPEAGNTKTAPRSRPLLITGKTGTLGRAFSRICAEHGLSAVTLDRRELDISDPASVARAIESFEPWAIVNAAGYVRVDDAEREEGRCFLENAEGPAIVAKACAARNIPLLTFSSDLVFGGDKASPYVESDAPSPLNAYGRSKAAAERYVLESWPSALVVRTSAFFGPWDEYNFAAKALASWNEDCPFEADATQMVTPTYVPSLVRICLDLLIDGECGLWHITNPDPVTWKQFATTLADLTGYPHDMIVAPPARHSSPLGLSRSPMAARPAYSALGSERGTFLPKLQECLQRFLDERLSFMAKLAGATDTGSIEDDDGVARASC